MQFFKTALVFILLLPLIKEAKAQEILFEFGQTTSTFRHSTTGPKKTFYSSNGQT